jgi:serine/threonine-protein kinase RsbW
MSYWSRSFLGLAECLSEVRQFTAAVLGDQPGVELVVLAVSELAANAIQHTASGEPGGRFVVHVATFTDRWQIRVDDSGGPKVPRVCEVEPCEAEAGRGLALVSSLCGHWGFIGDEYARAVWAEFPHPKNEDAELLAPDGSCDEMSVECEESECEKPESGESDHGR